MASIGVVIDEQGNVHPVTEDPGYRENPTPTASWERSYTDEREGAWMAGMSTSELLAMEPASRVSAAMFADNVIPPEVLAALAPGVNPFASQVPPEGPPLYVPQNPLPINRGPAPRADPYAGMPRVGPGTPEWFDPTPFGGGQASIPSSGDTLPDVILINSEIGGLGEVVIGDPRLAF